MWPLKRKTRQRRLEVRKSRHSGRTGYWRRFRQAGGVGSSLLAAGFLLAALLIDLFPPDPLPYRLGQYVRHDIASRVSFAVPSPRAIREQVQKARSATPARFRADMELIDRIVAALAALPGRLGAATQPAELEANVRASFSLGSSEDIAAWREYADPEKQALLRGQLDDLAKALLSTCIAPDAEVKFQREQRTARTVILLHDDGMTEKNLAAMVSLADQQKLAEETARLAGGFDPPLKTGVRTYLLGIFASGNPIYTYDVPATQAEVEREIEAVNSNPPSDRYEADQVLVYRTRAAQPAEGLAGLTGAELELLEQEHGAFVAHQKQHHPLQRAGALAGRTFMLVLIAALSCAYVGRYSNRIVKNHWRGSALVLAVLFVLAASKLTTYVLEFNPYSATFAVLFGAIVMAIAYDQRFALAIGALLALMVAMQLRQGFEMLAVLSVGVAACVFQLNDIRTRSKVMAASVVTAVLVFASVCALGAGQDTPWRFILIDGVWAAGGTLAAGMVLQVILPLVERAFGIATSLTLLEWCDASKPLLKRLATEAPGTWSHCLQLGSMCEGAAEAIGARGLLARVGAYYHDIGKINKPNYFAENQGDSPSRHDKLSPEMSLLIILAHVKDGLEMAREYGLPQVLHQFIATHHGTTLVQYFYYAAAEQRRAEADRAPEEVEFRYPGPKPQSQEAGILMLADAAESSVRAMSEPTPGRIEGQVRTMVNRRLMDGQLDECDMTLREVHLVEASLVKSLGSIHHWRVAYPTPLGQAPSVEELLAQQAQKSQQASQDPSDGANDGQAASSDNAEPDVRQT